MATLSPAAILSGRTCMTAGNAETAAGAMSNALLPTSSERRFRHDCAAGSRARDVRRTVRRIGVQALAHLYQRLLRFTTQPTGEESIIMASKATNKEIAEKVNELRELLPP